jgi:uncharacterized protein
MIQRIIQSLLTERIKAGGKIILLYGPRQVGKTTLAKAVIQQISGRHLEINADQMRFNDMLSSRDLSTLRKLVDGYDVLFIDEAQRITDIGINLKILHDEVPHLTVLATGSSALELANLVQEPLTGRTWTHRLFPIAVCELALDRNRAELDAMLEDLLIYGAYPGIFSITNAEDKAEYLDELTRSYLFKDVFELGKVKYTPKLRDLVRLLAYQIGSEVSINELSNKLQLHRDIVLNYIDLLEKSFVIFRYGGYSGNLRKEVTRHQKVYFYDLGVRNAIIENFKPLAQRDDGGKLWENFLMVERMKSRAYLRTRANAYFWRTRTGAELDLVEEHSGRLHGFEFKFSSKTANAPKTWSATYPDSTFEVVNRDNYLDFLLDI